MTFFHQLLNVLGRGTAGSRFKQLAALQQWHDREHTGARPQLENREQVGEIVAKHVTRNGDGVLATANSLEREFHRVHGLQDLDFQAGEVMVGQIGFHLLNNLRIVAAIRVEPEHRGCAGCPRPCHAQLHPVADGFVFRLAGAEDIATLHALFEQDLCRRQSTMRIVPLPGATNVLSCEPYSSAF